MKKKLKHKEDSNLNNFRERREVFSGFTKNTFSNFHENCSIPDILSLCIVNYHNQEKTSTHCPVTFSNTPKHNDLISIFIIR